MIDRAKSALALGLLGALFSSCAATDAGNPPPPPPNDCVGLSCFVASCSAGGDTVVQGIVTAPNGVDPVRQALIYVPESNLLTPLPQNLGCELCTSPATGRPVTTAYSDLDGRFVLRGVPTGSDIPIVVQKGRFRRLLRMKVTSCQTQNLPGDGKLPLPSNRSEGDLPQMAVAAGDHDAIECVLRDFGLSPGEFTTASGNGAVHLYDNQTPGNPTLPGQLSLPSLLTDRTQLFRYNVVFLDCSGTTYAQTLLADPAVLRNLRDYVATGGRLYVTDWSYDFIQQVPELSPFVCFEDDRDCSITTPHGFHAAPAHGGDGSPLTATVDQSTEGGRALAAWLQKLPAPVQASSVPISDLLPGWVMVRQRAADQADFPSTAWLNAEVAGRVRPLTLSFDYPPLSACGRVLFSSYHTRERLPRLTFPAYCPYSVGDALVQERVLEFLLLELSDCVGIIG